MYDDVSLFEDLSTELIREIFEYLAPHHLLHAFENLNSRFLSIITQHALCLPESDYMSRQTYQYYMKYILPKYASQFVSLHFSEVYAVNATTEFMRTINRNLLSVLAISLRSIKIVDIAQHTCQLLIDYFHHLPHVHTLLIKLNETKMWGPPPKEWHYLFDPFCLPSIFKTMPQLRSLCIYRQYDHRDLLSLSNFIMVNFPAAQHLHTLRISGCSHIFLVNLLNGGHVSRLRYLHVTFQGSDCDPSPGDDAKISFSHESVPELRQMHFKLCTMAVSLMLLALTDLYRYGQLEKITIDQSSCCSDGNENMVLAQDLHRWLLLSSSKSCFFRLFFNVVHYLPSPTISEQTNLDKDLVDFQTLFNASIKVLRGSNRITYEVSIFYPISIKHQQVKRKQDEHVHLQKYINITSLNSSDKSKRTKMEQQLMTVEHFINLRSLSFMNFDHETSMIERAQIILPLFFHIVDRAPRLEQLIITWADRSSSSIAMWLSEMSACNQWLTSLRRQFKYLQYEKIDRNLPFLDLVQLLINLFSDGNLEKLIFTDILPSDVLQTFDSFQQSICLLVERLPKLIYLSIRMSRMGDITTVWMQLTKWLSEGTELKLARDARWRCQDRTFDLWL